MKLPKKSDALVGVNRDLEDEEEGFLNPEDLSIIDEKTWEPSDEEILSYALKLGYDIEKDPDELFEVAYYYMKYPLPEGWKRAIFKKTKELMYINMEDGEIEVCTEIEEMAHQMYLEKKEEMLGKQLGFLDKEDKKDSKNVPSSTKIPPLNPLKKSASPEKGSSLLPPVKEKNGSKNNLFNEIENELNDKKKEKNDMGVNIDLDFDFDKEKKKKNNDDIFGISQKPIINSDNKDKDEEKENDDDKKDKNKKNGMDLYGIQAEESEEENEKEYGDDFDYDGLEDDSDLNKDEPLIKSMINKEKEKEEKEKKEKEEKEKREKEKREKEEKEKREKEEIERKEIEEKERKQKEEKEKRDKREKEERDKKEKEEREKRERELKEKREKEEKEKREKEEREEKIRKELEKEKELNDKLVKEKKEYLNKKLQELQDYKEQKKLKYEKAKKDKEEKNKKLKEEFTTKLQKDINKNISKFQSQFKEKLEFYETQLINKKLKEEKKFREEQVVTYEDKKKEINKRREKEDEEKKSKLKEKKTKLLKEINEEKNEKEANESNLKEKKLNLQKNIKLLDEKKKININNINKKHELKIKDYEIETEKKLIKEKEHIKESITNNSTNNNNLLNYNSSSSNLNFSMSGINKDDENNELIKSKIMENIQRALEDEFEINCKEIEQELNNDKMKEIEKYKTSMEEEKKDKNNFYKNEILSIEKEYYKTLSNIRQNTQKKKTEGDNYLNIGLEQTLTQHEETKNKISEDNKKLVGLVIEGIQKLIIQNNSLEQTEIQIEELLLELKDTYHMMFQKNKNKYEMAEYDYYHKRLFIKYLLEVINYLSKIFSSASTDIYDIDKKYISENLLKFCNDKINNYKRKFQNKKKKRIYKFLNVNLLSKNNSFSTISGLSDTNEINTIFVNSFKRKYEQESNPIDYNKNDNILNKIDINQSINNINKNSFIFKNNNNNLIGSMNNLNPFNTVNNYISSSNGFNNYNNLLRTKSTNDYNVNEKFLKLLNRGQDLAKLEYFVLEQNKKCSIPLIPEKILTNLDEETVMLYSEIIFFLKNEYLKLIEISDSNNKSSNNKNKKNINLNFLILDKIKIYTEDTFIFIMNNYQNKDQQRNIHKKIETVQNHIEDFKKNFNVDKYLENPNLYKTNSSATFGKKVTEDDLVNNMMSYNGQFYNKYNKNENEDIKTEINGMNNLILNGNFNFNGFQTK